MSLRQSTLKSVLWSFVATWGEQFVSFLSIAILARLLTPGDFGAVAIAAVAIYLCLDVIQQTVNQALVQRRNLEGEHLDSVFLLTLLTAGAAYLCMVAAAEWIAAFFDKPLIAELMPWLALAIPLTATATVPDSWLMREMRFGAIAVRATTAMAVGAVTAIIMAMNGWGVWSLVGQQLAYSGTNAIVVWFLCPWRPRLRFSRRHAGDIVGFGKYISGQGLIGALAERMEVVVVGYWLGATALGLYNVGHRVMRLLLNGVAGALVRVLMSSYSRLQSEPERLADAFYSTVRFASLVLFPLFIGMACVADEAVVVLLGDQWLAAIEVVRFLALGGLMQALGYFNVTLVVACGRPQWIFRLAIVFSLCQLVALAIGMQWGILGVAVALAVSFTLREPLSLWLVSRLVPLSLATYLRTLLPAALGSLAMTLTLVLLRSSVQGALPPFPALVLYVGVGALVYTATVCLSAPQVAREGFQMAYQLLRRRQVAPAGSAS